MGSSIMVRPERKYIYLGLYPRKISLGISFFLFYLCFFLVLLYEEHMEH